MEIKNKYLNLKEFEDAFLKKLEKKDGAHIGEKRNILKFSLED